MFTDDAGSILLALIQLLALIVLIAGGSVALGALGRYLLGRIDTRPAEAPLRSRRSPRSRRDAPCPCWPAPPAALAGGPPPRSAADATPPPAGPYRPARTAAGCPSCTGRRSDAFAPRITTSSAAKGPIPRTVRTGARAAAGSRTRRVAAPGRPPGPRRSPDRARRCPARRCRARRGRGSGPPAKRREVARDHGPRTSCSMVSDAGATGRVPHHAGSARSPRAPRRRSGDRRGSRRVPQRSRCPPRPCVRAVHPHRARRSRWRRRRRGAGWRWPDRGRGEVGARPWGSAWCRRRSRRAGPSPSGGGRGAPRGKWRRPRGRGPGGQGNRGRGTSWVFLGDDGRQISGP